MYFVIWKSNHGQFWYRVVGGNDETMAVSILFTSKQSAQSAIARIKAEANDANVVDMTSGESERP